jgi:hypothetical protein
MSRLRFTSWLLAGMLIALAPLARADVKYQPDEIALYVGDGRFFEKWEDYPFDREPYAKEGFYAYMQAGSLVVERPEGALVGAELNRSAFFGTIGSMVEYNSLSTNGLYNDIAHNTQDTTIGYMEKDQGWFVRFFNFQGHKQQFVGSNVGVIFNDPQGLLIGFYDLDGDGLDDSFDGDLNFGRDGGPIDAGDLVQQGVVFRSLHANLLTNIYTTEGNFVTRLPREICGAYWEPFCGVRYMKFDEQFNVEAFGGVLENSQWDTRVVNHLVGPQLGLRWFRTDGRWTFSSENRAMLAANFENIEQRYQFGDHLSQNLGRGTDPSTAGQEFFRSRFDRFVRRGGVNSAHELEIGGIAEATLQASYAITRQLSFDFGVRAMYLEGIGRPSSMVNYTFPTLGINTDNDHQRVFMAGGFFGVNLNR